jgi:hypothetical protein
MTQNVDTPERRFAARYTPSPIDDYAGNPLIEALPPILAFGDIEDQLSFYPELPTAEQLAQPAHHRFHYLARIRSLVVPLPEYVDFEPYISLMIRQGYITRNPLNDATWVSLFGNIMRPPGDCNGISNTQVAETILFSGISGTGKSTFIKRILSSYQQVIHHTINGKPLRQVTWLKVDCPSDATPISLCKNFLREIDRVLGSNYSAEVHSKFRKPDYLNLIGRVAATNYLGALILDEMQHINAAKSGGQDELLEQLSSLFDALQIPIIGIGTPPVTKIFERRLQNVRRSSSLGHHPFVRPASAEDESWKFFMKKLWEYQWLKASKKKRRLTETLSNAFYDHCQGITFFAVAMFTLCQYRLILDEVEHEVIDVDLLNDVANSELALLQPILQRIRSGELDALDRFDDELREEQIAELLNTPLATIAKKAKTNRRSNAKTKAKAPPTNYEDGDLRGLQYGDGGTTKSLKNKNLSPVSSGDYDPI